MKANVMKIKTQGMRDMEGYKEVHGVVSNFFKGDKGKTELWFTTPNPLLGAVTPEFMLINGRGHMLMRIVNDMVEGNLP